MGPGEDDACRHDWRPHIPGWFFDQNGDLRREYVCAHCGGLTLMGPGEYTRF